MRNLYINNRFHTTLLATIELTFTADDGSGDIEIKVERSKDGKRTVTSPTATDPEALLVALRSDFVPAGSRNICTVHPRQVP